MSGLDLDRLRTFQRVAELRSFSAAARRLDLTQPAVSMQVRKLERQLGTRLIDRLGRRVTLTGAGQELLAHAGAIEAAVAVALESVARHAERAAGRIRLGTGGSACVYLLPPVLRAMNQRFPGIEIVITIGRTDSILRAVQENVLDVGLVMLPASGRMLEVTPFLDEELFAIAPAARPLPVRVAPRHLAERPLILFEPGGNTRRITDAWFAEGGFSPAPIMSLGSVEAIKEVVGAGLGSAILPARAVEFMPADGAVDIRPLSPRLHRTLAVAVRRDKPLPLGLRELIDRLKGLGTRQPGSSR